MRRLSALTSVVLALSLVGCTPPAVKPTPAPTPTYRCTPEAGGAEYPCDQRAHDEMVAKDALYAEAEAVYRKLFAEEVRLYREGATISLAITDLAKGAYLLALEERHRQQHERGGKSVGGNFDLVYIQRNPSAVMSGSAVSLTICVDATSVSEVKGSQELGRGNRVRESLYFAHHEGRLKVSDFEATEVQSC